MDRSRADRILADWDRVSRQARRPVIPQRAVVTTALTGSALAGLTVLVIAIAAASVWLGLPQKDGSLGAARPESTSGTWGPLAVVPPSSRVMEALATGTLRVTDACAFLEKPGGDLMLLVWPADRTTWNANAHAITLENLDGSRVTFHDGDRVSLGGGGGNVAESGTTGKEWVRRTHWVASPAPSCPIDAWWYVGEAVAGAHSEWSRWSANLGLPVYESSHSD